MCCQASNIKPRHAPPGSGVKFWHRRSNQKDPSGLVAGDLAPSAKKSVSLPGHGKSDLFQPKQTVKSPKIRYQVAIKVARAKANLPTVVPLHFHEGTSLKQLTQRCLKPAIRMNLGSTLCVKHWLYLDPQTAPNKWDVATNNCGVMSVF